ncbi:MAG: amino acid adenylation domain-containing protein [Candidatus Glassbacteria bacterium]|nr:amino acid adenylation domain-containing protein [Candidatus Glassbacteria bacterium]
MADLNCRNTYLHEFFERTADRLPDSVAVEDHAERFTYAFLDERANRIAHCLLEAGCKPNERVCIFTGKNINAYGGVLGALKSGASWVPLGEDFPLNRLEYLIDLVEPKAVIVESHTLGSVLGIRKSLDADFKVLLLGEGSSSGADYDESSLKDFSSNRPVLDLRNAEDLAYIIFTSGSTGNPKGVMVLHRNIVQFLKTCFEYFVFTPGLRFAHHSELTFDPSLFDLFYCWGTGGTLVPFNRRRYRINPHLYVLESKINVWFSVPSVIEAMNKAGKIGSPDLSSLKHLILTGEPVRPELINLWKGAYPECRIYNVYGTTETAIFSHWYTFEEYLDPAGRIPVGTPLPGIGVYLMDGERVVDEGEEGECVFCGSQISPGYWRNEAENRTRYVPNPFDPSLPQTFYRSGDLLRRRPDGVYEYVGRIDRQVKVRGHRIELREVESVMISFPGIEEVAVVAVKGTRKISEAHLVAFLTAGQDLSLDALGAYLREKLPSYMVPTEFKLISETIPRNENKKIDYQILQRMAVE